MTGCGGSPPRDPEKYFWTDHFRNDAMPSNYRFQTKQMVWETIKYGRDCDRIEAGAGKLRRKKTYDGINSVLVLPEHEPVIITGWTEIDSLLTAMQSDRWTTDQIERIRAFTDLENRPDGPRYDTDDELEKPDWGEIQPS